ncbi:MAG: hypothetical protein QG618_2417, partial [Thermodesulfobacteriota bacterium]|nr:hypothetical protein [Thermodesulfobacteriota bacterium]
TEPEDMIHVHVLEQDNEDCVYRELKFS